MGNDYEAGMRLDEAIFRLESKARANGINYDNQFRKGIAALKIVNKEIAISLSGKKGEDIVAKTLEYIQRPNTTKYRNVYISNDYEETELDNVILTDSGIIILEIKNTKDDVTITEDGRLMHSGDECYEKQPLCEKMQKKRKLLKEKLEKIVNENGWDIPIYVESFIVFSTPKNIKIRVEDKFRKEKWCFRSSLTSKIDSYLGIPYYNNLQLSQLNSALSEIETQVKRFKLTVDFNEVRNDIATILAMFDEEAEIVETTESIKNSETRVNKKFPNNIFHILSSYKKSYYSGRTAVAMIGLLTTIACIGVIKNR